MYLSKQLEVPSMAYVTVYVPIGFAVTLIPTQSPSNKIQQKTIPKPLPKNVVSYSKRAIAVSPDSVRSVPTCPSKTRRHRRRSKGRRKGKSKWIAKIPCVGRTEEVRKTEVVPSKNIEKVDKEEIPKTSSVIIFGTFEKADEACRDVKTESPSKKELIVKEEVCPPPPVQPIRGGFAVHDPVLDPMKEMARPSIPEMVDALRKRDGVLLKAWRHEIFLHKEEIRLCITAMSQGEDRTKQTYIGHTLNAVSLVINGISVAANIYDRYKMRQPTSKVDMFVQAVVRGLPYVATKWMGF